jgi:hypothetical protein
LTGDFGWKSARSAKVGLAPLQFVDDDRLGFYSGRRPAFVVMEEIYEPKSGSLIAA